MLASKVFNKLLHYYKKTRHENKVSIFNDFNNSVKYNYDTLSFKL